MSPSHSNTRNRKYRYYVSQAIIQHRMQDAGTISKIPAGEIEKVVTQEIKDFVLNTNNIQPLLKESNIHKQKALLNDIAGKIDNQFIRAILSKVVIYKEKIEITICQNQLLKVIEAVTYGTDFPEELKGETKSQIILTKDIKISATSRNGSVLILTDSDTQQPEINPTLVKAIAKSYLWNRQLLLGEVKDFKEMQLREGHKDSRYIVNVINLRFLAPDIVESILNGTQRRDLSLQKLFSIKTSDWLEQLKILGL
jgi:site-specific DNA recombinase